jgi:peroxiredoxin
MQARYDKYKAQGYFSYLVIGQDEQSNPPTSTYCKKVRDQYKLTIPVLYDAKGDLAKAYGYAGQAPNERNLILAQGGKVVLVKQYAVQSAVQATIESELAK